MARGIFQRKGGSSRKRAERARKAHARRRAKGLTGAGTHYKGHPDARTKPTWIW